MDFENLRFPVLLRGAWFGINRAFREKLKETNLLTPVQYTLLRNLYEGRGQTLNQQALSNLLSTNKNNLADLLNRMEGKKLIKRHDNTKDQRNKSVSLTATGEKEFLRAREHALVLQSEILSLFRKKQQDLLMSYFARCNDRLEEIS
jgi:DNA-binding MarR family transcriptional regulator